MSQKASLSAIGGFVILGLALVVVAALYFGSGQVFRVMEKHVSFFPGSVQGITVGSAVDFRGVKVGEVSDIRIYYIEKDRQYDVAVFYGFWPDLVHTVEGDKYLTADDISDEELINVLGLRARLQTKSLVTGQQAVALEFLPDTPVRMSGLAKQGYFRGYLEIPALQSQFERLARKIQDLDLSGLVDAGKKMFDAVAQLAGSPELQEAIGDVRVGIKDARGFIASARAAVDDVRPAAIKALNQADSTLKTAEAAINEIRPVTIKSLKRADGAMKAVRDVVRKDSSVRYDLERALQEVANAAEAVRNLAEYINQNPDAFLRGRGE
jgi:paraquat-inducible protein B